MVTQCRNRETLGPKDWIPAFAGMTTMSNALLLISYLNMVQLWFTSLTRVPALVPLQAPRLYTWEGSLRCSSLGNTGSKHRRQRASYVPVAPSKTRSEL